MARAADPMKKVIKAALKQAEDDGWRDLTLEAIAAKAKMSLADLRKVVRDKPQILEKFLEQIDVEVLDSLDPDIAGEPARDRLFEVLMRRFEVLAPYKAALRAISKDLRSNPADRLALAGPGLRSMQWMMNGAGIEPHGLRGVVQVNGLAWVYVSVFRTWLEDEDPGLARTMADLDQKLRRGETLLRNVQVPIGLGQTLAQFVCSYRKARRDAATANDTEPAPSP